VVDARLTFVDTKILAYAHDRSETARQPVARALLEVLWRDRAGVLSTQALQELHVVATRRFDPPMARAAARELVVLDATWPVVQVDVPWSSPPRSWRSGTPCRSGTPWWSSHPAGWGDPPRHRGPPAGPADRRCDDPDPFA
jgi:hypothetical protein